jgi:hypothetical protein
MESALSRMMRERELQDASLTADPLEKPTSLQHGEKDSSCFPKREVIPVKQIQLTQKQTPEPSGNFYSLSDSPSKKTE